MQSLIAKHSASSRSSKKEEKEGLEEPEEKGTPQKHCLQNQLTEGYKEHEGVWPLLICHGWVAWRSPRISNSGNWGCPRLFSVFEQLWSSYWVAYFSLDVMACMCLDLFYLVLPCLVEVTGRPALFKGLVELEGRDGRGRAWVWGAWGNWTWDVIYEIRIKNSTKWERMWI